MSVSAGECDEVGTVGLIIIIRIVRRTGGVTAQSAIHHQQRGSGTGYMHPIGIQKYVFRPHTHPHPRTEKEISVKLGELVTEWHSRNEDN